MGIATETVSATRKAEIEQQNAEFKGTVKQFPYTQPKLGKRIKSTSLRHIGGEGENKRGKVPGKASNRIATKPVAGESKDQGDTSMLKEKWAKEVDTPESKKGMFDGKSKSELQSQYDSLKASGPHKKGSAEYTKMKELGFAIRAKGDWGKVHENVITEKSKTQKQARTMAAAAHNPAIAKDVGIPVKVAKEFNKKDKGTKLLSQAMKHKKGKKSPKQRVKEAVEQLKALKESRQPPKMTFIDFLIQQ